MLDLTPGLVPGLSRLDNLRSFRHLFRRAHFYELDGRKLKIVLEDAFALRMSYPTDIKIFLDNFEKEATVAD